MENNPDGVMINILLLGGGGREHAFAWKLAQSPRLGRLYIAPGNPGTALHGENVPIAATDFGALAQWALDRQIGMIVVGPEAPLVAGITDYFRADARLRHIIVIGPDQSGARLEGSKDFSKQFMLRHGIPTGRARTFERGSLAEGLAYLADLEPPYVLKADGLAAGKGVVIAQTLEEAQETLQDMIAGERFGEASAKVLVEEFLAGVELSVFALTDGQDYVLLPTAKDYKRVGEGDSGPNTGGMGAVSPVPFADEAFMSEVERRIVQPTITGLRQEGIHYVGFIYFGLMNVKGKPYVIEYNARMGDPETQAVMARLSCDLVELFERAAGGRLAGYPRTAPVLAERAATVVLTSSGYPEAYPTGEAITLTGEAPGLIFHAGTRRDADGQVVTAGGRVLAATGLGLSAEAALAQAYQTAESVQYASRYFRRDIGQDLLSMGG